MLILKLVLTCLVAGALAYPFISGVESGILHDINLLGPFWFATIALIFFVIVAFYCRSLQRCIELSPEVARATHPKSVWWMFCIPFNFVEDFFIIKNVSETIKRQMTAIRQIDPRIRSTGLFTGWAWCSWQIVSLFPSQIGQVGGAIAGLFWVAHWLQIARINAALKTHQELDTEQNLKVAG